MVKILDSTGAGYGARVNKKNRLDTRSVAETLQHNISHEDNLSFHVSADIAVLATEQDILFIQNEHESKNLVVTYIRVESAGVATPDENAYFSIGVGGTYTSGGTDITPINMFANSAIAASGTFVDATGTPIVWVVLLLKLIEHMWGMTLLFTIQKGL